MKKYAKIIDEQTKLCEVGIGDDAEFYQSLGMTEMEVEQAWNCNFYVAGYAPEKPEEVIKQERIAELHELLEGADYWTSKYCDGEYTEEEWQEKVAIRKAWREELRELEG